MIGNFRSLLNLVYIVLLPPSKRFARRSSFTSQVAYVQSAMPKVVAFWLPDSKDVFKKEREVSDALGVKFQVSHVRIVPGNLGLPLQGDVVVVLIARQVDLRDPAPIMALLRSSFCAPLHVLLKKVDPATQIGWGIRANSCGTSMNMNLDEAGLPAHPPPRILVDGGILGGEFLTTLLSASQHRRACQLFHSVEDRGMTEGIVDLDDKNGPLDLHSAVPATGGKKLYMKFAGINQRVTVMNPYHVLAAKGYHPWMNNLSVIPTRLAETMTAKAVPMNVASAFLLARQKLLECGAGPCQ